MAGRAPQPLVNGHAALTVESSSIDELIAMTATQLAVPGTEAFPRARFETLAIQDTLRTLVLAPV